MSAISHRYILRLAPPVASLPTPCTILVICLHSCLEQLVSAGGDMQAADKYAHFQGPGQHSELWTTSALSILAVFHLVQEAWGADSDPTMFQETVAFSHMEGLLFCGSHCLLGADCWGRRRAT